MAFCWQVKWILRSSTLLFCLASDRSAQGATSRHAPCLSPSTKLTYSRLSAQILFHCRQCWRTPFWLALHTMSPLCINGSLIASPCRRLAVLLLKLTAHSAAMWLRIDIRRIRGGGRKWWQVLRGPEVSFKGLHLKGCGHTHTAEYNHTINTINLTTVVFNVHTFLTFISSYVFSKTKSPNLFLFFERRISMEQTFWVIQSKNKGKLHIFKDMYVITNLPMLALCLRPLDSCYFCWVWNIVGPSTCF